MPDWELRYQLLIEAGRTLPEFADADKTEQNKIKGCFSPTWLLLTPTTRGYTLTGYSKSHIVLGLIALLAEYISTHSLQELHDLSVEDFASLAIGELITQTRQNGFVSMIQHIRHQV
jgi:cysteine desulfuration protein SufE